MLTEFFSVLVLEGCLLIVHCCTVPEAEFSEFLKVS